jgi:hypothetical protein
VDKASGKQGKGKSAAVDFPSAGELDAELKSALDSLVTAGAGLRSPPSSNEGSPDSSPSGAAGKNAAKNKKKREKAKAKKVKMGDLAAVADS